MEINVRYVILLSVLFMSTAAFFIQDNFIEKGVNVSSLLKLRGILRSIDGSLNNQQNPEWGKSYTNLKRRTPVRY